MQKYVLAVCAAVLLLGHAVGQVKIGGNPAHPAHSSAILELQDSTRGFLLPSVNAEQMQRIKDPANGLLVYNQTAKNMYMYLPAPKGWQPVFNQATAARLATDSCEWIFDTTSNKVFLRRGLALGDSVFYSTASRKFVFADKVLYTNSLGQTFPVSDFNGKYYFKGTASQMVSDTNNLNPSMLNLFFEVDNDPVAIANPQSASYNAVQVASVMNPTATQKAGALRGINSSTIFAGGDSLLFMNGMLNSTTVNGRGYAGQVTGFQNNVRLLDSAANNTGTIAGIRNQLTKLLPTTSINGNVYGYFGSMGGFNNISGSAYGIFLSNVSGAQPGRNFSIFSNKGLHRLGDSVLVTDNTAQTPRSVFDINASGAMIPPAGTNLQRPTAPVTAMMRYNTDQNNMEFYNGGTWKNFGDSEWSYDTASKRVYLTRGLVNGDSIFYNTQTKKMVFADRIEYNNSLGQAPFPVDNFRGKYFFKGTASRMTDTSNNADGSMMNLFYEIDNNSVSSVYTGLNNATVVNPKALQRSSQVTGITNGTIYAGRDSTSILVGLGNTTTVNGLGNVGTTFGINNTVRLGDSSRNNTGSLYGIRNTLTKTAGATGRVNGNLYGYFATLSGFAGRVDGSAYGVFINNISDADAGRNYALYTNRGRNRFGDSVVISTTGAVAPRAVLDVNSTTAMIVPTGTAAQRPTAPVAGMVRANTDNTGSLEMYNGSQWVGTIRNTTSIDIPNILANSSSNMFITVTGATVGSAVSLSPAAALPAGIVIAWARVSAANQIEVRFNNVTAAAINPVAQNFFIRVIQ